MEGMIKNAIFVKYGLNYRILSSEETPNRAIVEFSVGSELYIATYRKGGSQVIFYKMDKAVKLDD